MMDNILTQQQIESFRAFLTAEEKSAATIRKYVSDAEQLLFYASGHPLTRALLLEYKQHLTENYAPRSVNAKLAAANSLLSFLGLGECRVRQLRIQREAYCPEERELTKSEYLRLLAAAGDDERLNLAMQTICATGIRVSELSSFTVEAVRLGTVPVRCKGKSRKVFLPGTLRNKLLRYARKCGIRSGAVFRTAGGKPIDRSNLWSQMKRLCAKAGVNPRKVFPHNLRKLFARTFYAAAHDIAKLADILGHSSVNTTRIYIMTTGLEHRRIIESLHLTT